VCTVSVASEFEPLCIETKALGSFAVTNWLMKRHGSHWHGWVVLVQIDGVGRKDVGLQEGLC